MAELTQEQIALAMEKFGVSEEEIRARWAELEAGGRDKALEQMQAIVGEIEHGITEVMIDVLQRWIPTGPEAEQQRAMSVTEFYQETLEHTNLDEVDKADLMMKLSVAIYMLAESEMIIASLSDGNRRQTT